MGRQRQSRWRDEKKSENDWLKWRERKTVDVTSETNWKYEFKNLPKYDMKEREYTVTEDHVKDYTTDINGTTITKSIHQERHRQQ